ncbi:MAG: cytochrome P450 [Asticcacaulis sp.]
MVSLISANRDDDRISDPHRFDIRRKPNPHLAFGAGAHICVGAPLARIEGQLAIMKLFERFPDLHRADDSAPDWRAVPGIPRPDAAGRGDKIIFGFRHNFILKLAT